MRAVIYNRVSSDPSGKARSVEDQERENRAVCEQRGWTVAEVLTDNDRSATRFATRDRPEYQRLYEILRKGDVLVTWESSRAQRDLESYVDLRNLSAEVGAYWCYSGRLYDLNRSDDRFATGLDALLAEKEGDQIRERIMRGHRSNLEAGRPHGHVPYGYRVVRDQTTGRPEARVPDEAQAPIVKEVARRVLVGESLRSLVIELNARTPGKVWRPSTLRRMLINPTYAGYRTHNGQIVREGTWEPLVSHDEHDRLVALFAANRSTSTRGSAPKYLLTGIAECGVCDEPLQMRQQGSVPAAKKRPDGKLWFYGCERGHVGRDREKVDDAVKRVIVALLSNPAELAKLAEPLPPTPADRGDDANELRDRLNAAADAYDAGKLSIDMLAKVEARLRPRIEAAEKRQQDRYPSPVVAQVATAPDPCAAWDGLPLGDKRAFLRATVQVVVYRVRSRWELGVEVYPRRRKP